MVSYSSDSKRANLSPCDIYHRLIMRVVCTTLGQHKIGKWYLLFCRVFYNVRQKLGQHKELHWKKRKNVFISLVEQHQANVEPASRLNHLQGFYSLYMLSLSDLFTYTMWLILSRHFWSITNQIKIRSSIRSSIRYTK